MDAKFRRINSKGGLTIPTDLRREFGLEGVGVKIESWGDGFFVISKAEHVCIYCKTKEGKQFNGVDICPDCAVLIFRTCAYPTEEKDIGLKDRSEDSAHRGTVPYAAKADIGSTHEPSPQCAGEPSPQSAGADAGADEGGGDEK